MHSSGTQAAEAKPGTRNRDNWKETILEFKRMGDGQTINWKSRQNETAHHILFTPSELQQNTTIVIIA